ncbi:ubiquinol-cytochrome C chaperone family protein [Altererythrobacter sp. MF3-039]|uniref:ubiquinol-cytochrome C chaperone family protein n=1 Tax=Altererythrobacter sp. MF3-039 TaxID=3252901 RepID=UPI00390CD77D
MSLLARLFQKKPDPREEYHALWLATIAKARDPFWYRDGGVADTREGRFDMVTAILALVIARLGKSKDLERGAAYLTEFFVEDMEGQLREEGIGDPTVVKRIGKMMSALGGRIGAYSLGAENPSAMEVAVERNVTMDEDGSVSAVVGGLIKFHGELAELTDADLLAGSFAHGALS